MILFIALFSEILLIGFQFHILICKLLSDGGFFHWFSREWFKIQEYPQKIAQIYLPYLYIAFWNSGNRICCQQQGQTQGHLGAVGLVLGVKSDHLSLQALLAHLLAIISWSKQEIYVGSVRESYKRTHHTQEASMVESNTADCD